MIIDSITNCHNYFGLNTRFSSAFEYILSTDFSKFEPGRYDVDGNEIFVMVSEYETKPAAELKWEAHRKYIDIHLMVKGTENFGYANIDTLNTVQPYDDAKEVLLMEGEGGFLKLGKDSFVIAFPQDAHMPGVLFKTAERVKKIVVKVKLGLLPFVV